MDIDGSGLEFDRQVKTPLHQADSVNAMTGNNDETDNDH